MVIIYEIGKEVPLHESRLGSTFVFILTTTTRAGEGQQVATLLTQGFIGKKVDAWKAAFDAPVPIYSPTTMTMKAYWEAQALALMYPRTKNAFNVGTVPEENMEEYVGKFVKWDMFADVSPKVYVLTVILLGRAMDRDPVYTLTRFNYERLILAAFVVALKDVEGSDYKPRDFGAILGITGEDVDKLDLEFRRVICNEVHVSEADYFSFNRDIMLEVLDSFEHRFVLPTLRRENIMDVDAVLNHLHISGDRQTPPQIFETPVKVGDKYRGVLISSPAHAESVNHAILAECVDDWRNGKIMETQPRFEAYVRVFKKQAPAIRMAENPQCLRSSFS